MKICKYTILLILLICPIILYAQINVGVMNQAPEDLLHIDAAENNSSAPIGNKYLDDVIFTKEGKLGIGVNAPQNTIHIHSSGAQPVFKLEDGTQQNGYLLTSDADGYASWKEYKANSSVLWYFGSRSSYQNMYFSANIGKLSGATSTVTGMLPGFVHNTNSTLLVPKGKYIVAIHGDINNNELGEFGLYGKGVSTGIGKYFIRFWYQNYLNASATVLSLTEDVVMEMHGRVRDSRAQYWGTGGKTSPNNWYGAFYQISFIKLK